MILEYILQVIIFQLVFLLIYEFWLQKETFFNLNRGYLLATPLMSFLIPFIRISSLQETAPAMVFQNISDNTVIWLPEVFIGGSPQNEQLAISSATAPNMNWWLIIYIIGVVIALGVFFYKLYRLEKLSKSSRLIQDKYFKIYEIPNSNAAFTYFESLYIGAQISEKEREQIITHELVHLHQKHGLDLILFEFLKIAFWFNPMVYLYQSRLATLHEFIADENTVRKTGKKSYFEGLLNTAFGTSNISFTNQFFNHSLIKKRIIMLQKNKSNSISKFKFLIIIPLMLAMLTYVACSEDNTVEESPRLSEYSYTLNKGEGMTTENQAVHNKFESFLFSNPDYVSWATIEKNSITYTIHPADEKIPSGYRKLEVGSPDGQSSYIMYMNLNPGSEEEKRPEDMEAIKLNKDYDSAERIPFALIEQVPVFEECKDLPSGEAQKKCVSRTISSFVNRNFNTDLGKELGLTGIHRVIVQFRIDETGRITDIKSRAPRPELEKEAERVIASLPKMEPGMHRGKKVSVMYSLPIAFKVAE